MKFSYEWLQSYFEEKLPRPEKLAELLTLHSFETEVTKDGNLDIDVLPNRVSDCASHLGIAREISIIQNLELKTQNYKTKKGDFKSQDYVSVEVEDKELCPRYVALVVRGVEVKESPEWMQKRLLDIGQKPVNNIVDAGNYAMLETGQPLHAFDLDKIGQRKIIVRKAKEGERLETLDNRGVDLSTNMAVIADGREPMVIAGIKGGKNAGISHETKDIVIEAAVFNGPNIRKTSKEINIRTDASMRFEHGLSLFLPEIGVERVAQLINEVAGGEVAKDFIDVCGAKPEMPNIEKLTEEEVEKKLGIKISQREIDEILSKLILKERTDINIKEDLIEEVGRIYGYENIESKLPGETKIPPVRNEEYLYCNWIKGILAGMGLTEVYNYSFGKIGGIELKNPASSDKTHLRNDLTQGLLNNIEENFKNFDSVKFFEIGKTFYPEEKEITKVAVAIGYKNSKHNVEAELRGVADALFIKDADKYIKENIFEVSLSEIIDAAQENGMDLVEFPEFEPAGAEYKPFSRYPAVIRDISLFVPEDIQVIDVMNIIENIGGELLIDTDLFDLYEPPGEDRKSLAFRLIFQSFEKTLTDKEVNYVMDEIINALEENQSWQVRKK